MEDYKAKQRIRKKIYSPWVFIVLLVITVVLTKGAWGVFFKQQESAQNLDKVRAELAKAEQREAELEAGVSYLKTEEGIEEEIRDKYSVARPGEELVLIVEPKDRDVSGENSNDSWWGRVGTWFGNLFE